jgi:hypothetical protein
VQGGRGGVDRWAVSGVGSGRAGVATVVRVLTAAVLLGVALLIVALVGQGVAGARGLTAEPAAVDGDALPTAQPAGGEVTRAGAVTVLTAAETSGHAHADYLWSRGTAAGVLAQSPSLLPLAGGGIREAGAATQAQPPGPYGPSDLPAAEDKSNLAPHWGEAWRRETPRVAHAPTSTDDPTGDAPSGGRPSSPGQPVGGMAVAAAAQAQPPSSRPPRSGLLTSRTQRVYNATIGTWQGAEALASRIIINQESPVYRSLAPEVARLKNSTIENVVAARALAGATVLGTGASIAEASPAALEKVTAATSDLRELSELAERLAGMMDEGAAQLRREAEDAVKTADTADHQVATIRQPEAGAPRSATAIVDPVAAKAVSLAKATAAAAGLTTNKFFAVLDADTSRGLSKAVNRHTVVARLLDDWGRREPALDAVKAATGMLRAQASLAQKVDRELQSDSKDLRERAQRAAYEAGDVDALVSGGVPQPAPPAPAKPQPSGEQGGEVDPEPSLDAPVTQHADIGEGANPATAAAAVEGGDGTAREHGEDGVDVAGEQPMGFLDASSDPLSFDNSDMFADDAFANPTTFADTG